MAKDQKDFAVEVTPYNPLRSGLTPTVVYREVRVMLQYLINLYIMFLMAMLMIFVLPVYL
jgi:hypothetical protein